MGLVLLIGVAGSAVPCQATFYPGFIDSLQSDSSLVVATALQAKPAYLQPRRDPIFGTLVTRITGDSGTVFFADGASWPWSPDARHHYSKDQPWNSDGTLIAVQNSGESKQVYLDGETYQVKGVKCPNYDLGDDRWHPSREHPFERINVKGDELMWFNVVDCVKTRTWKLPFRVNYLGAGEGCVSLDGRFVALHDSTRVFVVDMDPQPPFDPYPAQRIGPSLDVSKCELASGCEVSWASVTPSGKYVVVKYDGEHPRVFDVHPKSLSLTPRPMTAALPPCSGGDPSQGYIYDLGHPDMALDPFDGDEDVIIGQEHCRYRGSWVGGQLMGGLVMVRLRDGAVTSLTDPTNEAYPHFISARNLDRPGWVYVDYTPEPGKRFSDEIVAVKLDGSQAVQRFARKHSAFSGCYRCESHAVPSRDGRRVIWASNWLLDCTVCGPATEIKDYVVDARDPRMNLVKNSSFEVDSSGWMPYATAVLARTPGGVDGWSALDVTSTGLGTFGVNDSPNWVSSTPNAGWRYRVTAWVRSALSRGQVRLSVREYLNGQQVGVTQESPAVTPSAEWQRLAFDCVTGAAGSSLDLRVLDAPVGPDESFELDCVSVQAVSGGVTAVPPARTPSGAKLRLEPNPLRSAATLRFATSRRGALRVWIVDLGGRVVRRLAETAEEAAGEHSFHLDGRDSAGHRLPSGVYFCRILSVDGAAAKRFVILD